jgi:hypothetical protein
MVASRLRAVTSTPAALGRRLAELDNLIVSGDAKCRRPGTDPDDWYPVNDSWDRANDPAVALETQRFAQQLCAGCPLLTECRERAELLPYDDWGVIAGTTPTQRRIHGIGTYPDVPDEVAA